MLCKIRTLFISNCGTKPLTWVTTAAMVVMTLWSGIDYIKTYWKYIDPEK